MKKTIYNYRLKAIGFLFIMGLAGLGATHSLTTRNSQAGLSLYTSNPIIQNNTPIDIGIPAKTFFAVVIDNSNNKWFLTELGIISFNGEKWTLHNGNNKVPSKDLKDFAYEMNTDGPDLWIASANGAAVASLPIDAKSDATAYLTGNTPILSNNVVKVAIGGGFLRWFGTDKGISAYRNNTWLTPSYDEFYLERMFQDFPITSMDTNLKGDSLYVGTEGAGIFRVFQNEVDGISGASVYAQWGPIILPSDKIYSVFIDSDGTKWFGTDQGIAKHTGNNTLENWTVYTTEEGLVNNFVQAITSDNLKRLWFGTRGGGISIYDGYEWTTFTADNGLNSNNILCIATDRDGLVWIGTDDGVCCYNKGKFISYR